LTENYPGRKKRSGSGLGLSKSSDVEIFTQVGGRKKAIMKIKRKVLLLIKSLINRDYRFLCRNNPPFDVEFFYTMSGYDRKQGDDPFWLYVMTERAQRAQLNFKNAQWQQLTAPHSLFDVFFYLNRYFPDGLKRNAFVHYLSKGWKSGLWPSPYFNPEVYRKRSGWSEDQGDPLTHYTKHGAAQGISPGVFFDVDYYLDKTPILHQFRTGIIRHYRLYGALNGKNPIPAFDPQYYLSRVEVSSQALRDPLSHYLCTGDKDNLRPNEWFDSAYYLSKSNDQAGFNAGPAPALSHYLEQGVYEGRYTDRRIETLGFKPLVSVIVPVYKPTKSILNSCIRSVLYQTYPHWELCLADDNSNSEELKELLINWATKDSRIKVAFHQENQGISKTTNTAAGLAEGTFLGFLDNDDELAPDCLYHVVEKINNGRAQVIYTDEDLIGDDASRFTTFLKPDFNLNLLFSHNYITHFLVVEKQLYDKIGGFDSRYDGAQDYDLILKLSEHTEHIAHISKILYHWRALETSTNINHEQKTYAHEAGRRALEASLGRRGVEATIADAGYNYFYRIKYKKKSEPRVSVFFQNESEQDSRASESFLQEMTDYQNCDFISCSNAVRSISQQSTFFDPGDYQLESLGRAKVLHDKILSSRGDYLVFLTRNVVELEQSWVDELILPLLHSKSLGLTCGRVNHQSGMVHSFSVPDLANDNVEYWSNFFSSYTRDLNGMDWPQLVSVCDWDVCMMSRDLYNSLGGFDFVNFPNFLAMLDLSLRVEENGSQILYTPYASVTVGDISFPDQTLLEKSWGIEKQLFQKRWYKKLSTFDPCWNSGVLTENKIDKDTFFSWLAGKDFQETLD
jgi:glycosyltransferase involved in cell wall biosynthesis